MAIPQAPVWPSNIGMTPVSQLNRYITTAQNIFPGESADSALSKAYPNVYADVKALGGISSYTKAAQKYEDDYAAYNTAFKKYSSDKLAEANASRPPKKTAEQRAAEKAQAAIDSAILKDANKAKQAAFDAALEQRNDVFDTLLKNRNDAYAEADALYKSGEITRDERTALRTQAQNTYTTEKASASNQYTLLKDAARSVYDDVYLSVKGTLPKETTPLFDTAAFDAAMETYKAAIKSGDKSQKMPSLMDYMTVSTEELFSIPEIDKSPLYTPGFEPTAERVTRDQASDLADQLILYGGVKEVTDQGEPVEDPKAYLEDAIYRLGFDNVYKQLEDNGFEIRPQIDTTALEGYMDPDVAKKFVTDVYSKTGFNPETDANFTSWTNSAIRKGFEGFLESWNKSNPNYAISLTGLPKAEGEEKAFSPSSDEAPVADEGGDGIFEVAGKDRFSEFRTINVAPYLEENQTALDAYLEKYTADTNTQFLQNVNDIIGGADLSITGTKDFSGVTDFDDFVTESGFNWDDATDETKQTWQSYFDTYGPELSYGMLQLASGVQRPEQVTDITSTEIKPFESDLYGDTGVRGPGEFVADINKPAYGETALTGTTPTTPSGEPRFAFTPGQISGYTPTTGVAPVQTTPVQGTTYQPAPYTPPALLAAAPARPTLTPAEQMIGAPAVERPVGAPMQALTPEQAGSQFVPPTQEDYFAYFGYTPEQLNAAQFLAELEGAPRAGVAAQTIPVLPTAVEGAPPPTGMKEGGMPQDAQRLANQGRGGDTMLVHMAPEEVAGLQALARQVGTSLTVNPQTGLPEALKLRDILGPAVVLGATVLTGGAVTPLMGSLAFGAGYGVGSGSLEKGLMAGIGAYTGANLASAAYTGVTGAALPGYTMPTPTGAEASSAGVSPELGGVSPTGGSSGPLPGVEATTEIMGTAGLPEKTLVERATDYLQTPSTVPTSANSIMGNVIGFTTSGEMAKNIDLAEQMEAQAKRDAATQAAITAKRDREYEELFQRTLGSVPVPVKSGGLIALAGGGMTYAEGGGTTGPTNEPRMVKGTGDGMSDSVPATIEGVQEARLANDEFVIPADVVADLGNGSSSAGAQQLYDMMDRVRQARHGTTEQPPEVNARKLMPA